MKFNLKQIIFSFICALIIGAAIYKYIINNYGIN